VYLHSHSGCQVEARELTLQAVQHGFSVCSFDFSGYGRSEGQYGTLGVKECRDVESIIEHLSSKEKFRNFFLWGRSMGAATAIRYCAAFGEEVIKGLVLDSPFSDAKTMICDILAEEKNMPRFLTSLCLLPIGSTLKEETGCDVLDNAPVELAKLVRVPALVMVGNDDTVTLPERVHEVFSTLSCTVR
jgi:alpha-beta hydrolase superfamily lysophospholipase